MSKHKNKAQDMYGTHGVPSEPCPCDYINHQALEAELNRLTLWDQDEAANRIRKILSPIHGGK